jgi:hypothetical protein
MLYQRQLIGSQSAGLIGVILKRSIRKLYGNRVIYYTRALRSRFQCISMTLLFLFGSGFGSLAVGPATSAAYRSAPAGKQGVKL